MNNQKPSAYIQSLILMFLFCAAAFLFLPFFSLKAWAEEHPGGGTAIDGTLHDVTATEISKGNTITFAPDAPGAAAAAVSQNLDTPPQSAPPKEAAGSASSPVITCGAGQKTVSPKEDAAPIPIWTSLGMFATTGYCNCEICSHGFQLTYAGTVPKAKHTLAADLSRLPLGTEVMIDHTVYTVEDIGSRVVGNMLDIYYDTHEEAMAHGRQMKEIFILAGTQ